MFRSNKRHLQPAPISNVNELPKKRRQRLEESWAGTFRSEFFSRLKEEAFAVLYVDVPSQPNVPVNVLVSLDSSKRATGGATKNSTIIFYTTCKCAMPSATRA